VELLKRVSWKVGQPLLPHHLVAQENYLVAHTNASLKHVGLPIYGIGALKWDDTLLEQGIVSITELSVVFAVGSLVNVPGNGTVRTFDLNNTGKNRVTLYLHLLSSENEKEEFLDSGMEHERIIFAINDLELSDDQNAPLVKAALKLAELEKDLENRWKLCGGYIPPLMSVQGNPFLNSVLIELKTKLEQFQSSIEMVTVEGEDSEGNTLEMSLCLLEVAKMRRLLLNIDHHVATHPYYLYEAFSQYLDTIALFYNNKTNFKLVPYQHEKLGPLFKMMVEALSLESISNQQISHLEFEKKDRCYVSEKLPLELQDAKEIYLILQKVETTGNPNVEGAKLSAYSRLMNTVIFGVQGIPIVRIERAPFNHSFSKRANIYTVEKGVELGYALKEGRLAFDYKGDTKDIQAYLYWR